MKNQPLVDHVPMEIMSDITLRGNGLPYQSIVAVWCLQSTYFPRFDDLLSPTIHCLSYVYNHCSIMFPLQPISCNDLRSLARSNTPCPTKVWGCSCAAKKMPSEQSQTGFQIVFYPCRVVVNVICIIIYSFSPTYINMIKDEYVYIYIYMYNAYII